MRTYTDYTIYVCRWLEIALDIEQHAGARFVAKRKAAQLSVMVLIILASSTVNWSVGNQNIQMWCELLLWCGETIFYIVSTSFGAYFYAVVTKKSIRHNLDCPVSIAMYIHRVGEFVTLMLGESVLCLLVVVDDLQGDVGSADKVLPFITLMASVCCLHFDHFTTYPDRPENHVMRQSVTKGTRYLFTAIYGYATALLAAGVGAKYLLKHASAEDEPHPKMTKAYCFSLAVSILLVKIMRLYHVSLAVHAPPFFRLTFDDFCTE